MKALKLFAVTALLAITTACVSTTAVQNDAKLETQVYAMQSDYVSGVRLAQVYKDLPRCGAPQSPKVCSNVDVIRRLQTADQTAYDTLVQAEKTVRTPGFGVDKATTAVASAKAAVGVFLNLARQYEVK